jgi:hypothetical protein
MTMTFRGPWRTPECLRADLSLGFLERFAAPPSADRNFARQRRRHLHVALPFV